MAGANFDKAVRIILQEKMTLRQPHSAPLFRQALGILSEMRSLPAPLVYIRPRTGQDGRAPDLTCPIKRKICDGRRNHIPETLAP